MLRESRKRLSGLAASYMISEPASRIGDSASGSRRSLARSGATSRDATKGGRGGGGHSRGTCTPRIEDAENVRPPALLADTESIRFAGTHGNKKYLEKAQRCGVETQGMGRMLRYQDEQRSKEGYPNLALTQH